MTEPKQSPEQKPCDKRVFNAYRHGLTGHVLIITPADEQPYKDHCQGIHQYFAPVGGMEIDLVQQIADDRWRMKNAAAWEAAIITRGLNRPDDALSGNEQVDALLAAGRVWDEKNKEMDRLSLYENRIQRRVERNVALFRQLEQARREALQRIVEEAAILGETYDFPAEALAPEFCLFKRSNHPPRLPLPAPPSRPKTHPEGRLKTNNPAPNPHPQPRARSAPSPAREARPGPRARSAPGHSI